MNRFTSILAAAAIAITSSSAFATGPEKGGVQIGGSAVQVGVIDKNANVSLGKGAIARTRVSAVNGDVSVGKDLVQVGVIKTNANVALGENAEACTEVATMGSYNSACE